MDGHAPAVSSDNVAALHKDWAKALLHEKNVGVRILNHKKNNWIKSYRIKMYCLKVTRDIQTDLF